MSDFWPSLPEDLYRWVDEYNGAIDGTDNDGVTLIEFPSMGDASEFIRDWGLESRAMVKDAPKFYRDPIVIAISVAPW